MTNVLIGASLHPLSVEGDEAQPNCPSSAHPPITVPRMCTMWRIMWRDTLFGRTMAPFPPPFSCKTISLTQAAYDTAGALRTGCASASDSQSFTLRS